MKTMVVGEYGVGKTSLLSTYIERRFPSDYLPTIYDVYSGVTKIDGTPHPVSLWDTGGGEDYVRLRPLSYPGTFVFILVYSVANLASFESIKTVWQPELTHHCPGIPILLVATKTDLRDDPQTMEAMLKKGQYPVTYEQGMAMSIEIGAAKFLECSPLKMEGVDEVFEEATRLALRLSQPNHLRSK